MPRSVNLNNPSIKKIFLRISGIVTIGSIIISILIFILSNQPQIEIIPDTNYKINNYFDQPFILKNNSLLDIQNVVVKFDSFAIRTFSGSFNAQSENWEKKSFLINEIKSHHTTVFFLRNYFTRPLVYDLNFSSYKLKIKLSFNYMFVFNYGYTFYFEAMTRNNKMEWFISNDSFRKER